MSFVVGESDVVSLEGQWSLPIAILVLVQTICEELAKVFVLHGLHLVSAVDLAAVVNFAGATWCCSGESYSRRVSLSTVTWLTQVSCVVAQCWLAGKLLGHFCWSTCYLGKMFPLSDNRSGCDVLDSGRKKCRHKFPSNNKPNRFWNTIFPLNIRPSHYEPPKKRYLKNISPGAYFRNFMVYSEE